MDSTRWITVSDSQRDHEREALAWLRQWLPDREPYHVWTNFEFTTHNGQVYEVDALAFWTQTFVTNSSGTARDTTLCYSADGPSHWVTSSVGVSSNTVQW